MTRRAVRRVRCAVDGVWERLVARVQRRVAHEGLAVIYLLGLIEMARQERSAAEWRSDWLQERPDIVWLVDRRMDRWS